MIPNNSTLSIVDRAVGDDPVAARIERAQKRWLVDQIESAIKPFDLILGRDQVAGLSKLTMQQLSDLVEQLESDPERAHAVVVISISKESKRTRRRRSHSKLSSS